MINVPELDSLLTIDHTGIMLESKSKESSMPNDSMSFVIGRHYHTWPTWKRAINMEELNMYNELFDEIENRNDIKYEGSTPPKRKHVPSEDSKTRIIKPARTPRSK